MITITHDSNGNLCKDIINHNSSFLTDDAFVNVLYIHYLEKNETPDVFLDDDNMNRLFSITNSINLSGDIFEAFCDNTLISTIMSNRLEECFTENYFIRSIDTFVNNFVYKIFIDDIADRIVIMDDHTVLLDDNVALDIMYYINNIKYFALCDESEFEVVSYNIIMKLLNKIQNNAQFYGGYYYNQELQIISFGKYFTMNIDIRRYDIIKTIILLMKEEYYNFAFEKRKRGKKYANDLFRR